LLKYCINTNARLDSAFFNSESSLTVLSTVARVSVPPLKPATRPSRSAGETAPPASGFVVAVRNLTRQRLEELGDKVKRGEYVPAIEYVNAYARLGDKQNAFAWLEKLFRNATGLRLK
jgi:hypothetical protein